MEKKVNVYFFGKKYSGESVVHLFYVLILRFCKLFLNKILPYAIIVIVNCVFCAYKYYNKFL